MNLAEDAAAFTRTIVEDAATGFATPVEVTDPHSNPYQINGIANDIAMSLDPGTGAVTSARKVTVALSIAGLKAAGLTELPRGENDPGKGVWLITFTNLSGERIRCKVKETMPDRTLGLVVCVLEPFNG